MQPKRQKSASAAFTALRGRRLQKAVVVLVLLALVLMGSWFLLRVALGTEYPLIPVSSGSMCVLQKACDGFSHPFGRSLHRGDLVAVQSIDARNVHSAYPNSDVIVFRTPKQEASQEDSFTISRVVSKEEIDGVVYFRTKSDGQGVHVWPEVPDVKECDRWFDYRVNYTKNGMISEKLLVGKVVFRLPWVGYFVFLLFGSSSMFVVVALVAVLVVVTFVYPRFRGRKTATEPKNIPQAS
jgi:hypothetical protein